MLVENKTMLTYEEARKNHPVEMESIRDQISKFTWKMGKYKIPHNEFPFPEAYEFYYHTFQFYLNRERTAKMEIKQIVAKLRRFDSVFTRELEKRTIPLEKTEIET